MPELAQETEHVDQALARLVEQFKASTRLRELLTQLVTPLQEVDDALWQLQTQRWVDLAEGANLDVLGAIVGQPREGRTDTIYRFWIKARIRANRANGHPDDTLEILLLIAADADVSLVETPPAAYIVEAFGLGAPPASIFGLLELAKPAGVRLNLLSNPDDAHAFAWSDTPAVTDTGDSDHGLGTTTNPATGGKLSGII